MSDRFSTVEDYITDVRVLLQDTVTPNRYTDPELLAAFNTALLEGRRLRPDLFIFKWGNRVPSFSAVTGQEVHIEEQFRLAFVYGTCAHALRRDDDDVQDERANSFFNVFQTLLIGVKVPPITGGTPGPGAPQK